MGPCQEEVPDAAPGGRPGRPPAPRKFLQRFSDWHDDSRDAWQRSCAKPGTGKTFE